MVVLTLNTPQGTLELLLRITGHEWESEEPSKHPQEDEISTEGTAPDSDTQARSRAELEARLRDILQALIKAVSKNKPTRFEAFAVQWLDSTYKKSLSSAQSARVSHDSWTSRSGVFRNERELNAYLLEIRLPMLLEVAVSAAVLMNPYNVPSFLMDFFLQAQEEAIRFEAKMTERAAGLSIKAEAKADARKPNEKVSGGGHLKLSYDVGEDGKLSVDFCVTASPVAVES